MEAAPAKTVPGMVFCSNGLQTILLSINSIVGAAMPMIVGAFVGL